MIEAEEAHLVEKVRLKTAERALAGGNGGTKGLSTCLHG